MTREIPPTPAPDPREERSARVFLTVAICTQNRGQFLMDAAVSVIKQLESETELLIIDNASTDETPLIARKLTDQHERVRTIYEERCGRSHARNRALSEAWGEYLVFLDDDELAEPGWLKCYIDFFRNPPSKKVGSVGGPYIPQFDAQRPPAWLSPTHGGFDLGGERRVLEGVVGPAGGNCGFSRKAAIDAGGFDPELIRTEDSDLNRKIRSAGYEVWWMPEARIRHRIPSTLFSMSKQLAIWFTDGRDVTVMRLKTTPWKRLLFVIGRLPSPLYAAFQVIAAAAFLIAGRQRTAFRILSRAARNIGIFTRLCRLPR